MVASIRDECRQKVEEYYRTNEREEQNEMDHKRPSRTTVGIGIFIQANPLVNTGTACCGDDSAGCPTFGAASSRLRRAGSSPTVPRHRQHKPSSPRPTKTQYYSEVVLGVSPVYESQPEEERSGLSDT